MKQADDGLQKGLNQRHIFFIALGSAIGTGLFYGSAKAINLAGPSVILAYLISGIVVFFVMRALGEMVVRKTLVGSFGSYASLYIGPLAGFITGWSYIVDLGLVCLADVTAIAIYMGFWFPDVSPWLWSLGIALIIAGINLCNVKVFGEMEFWLSMIKVLAIIGMTIGGIMILFNAYMQGITAESTSSISNLWRYDGFMPNGIGGMIASFSVVVFAFGGIEIVGLTASEAQDVNKNLPRAINTLPVRILLFYVMTLIVLLSLFPWNQIGMQGSPFVTIFEALGITSAAHILNVVVISAAISAINSDLYGTARMMMGLAQEGLAPGALNRVSKQGSPIIAVWVIFGVLMIGVVLNYFFHDELFITIAALATFGTVWTWLMIMLAHFSMRMKMDKQETAKSSFPIPFWPVAPILTIAFLLFVIVILGVYNPSALIGGAIWMAILVVSYYIWVEKEEEQGSVSESEK